MAIKKVEMRPDDGLNYGDVIYPKTSTDMVVGDDGETLKFTLKTLMQIFGGLGADLNKHKTDGNNPHGTNKSHVGLSNLINSRQMPISGGQFTGIAKADSNTSYTTPQIRNTTYSTGNPSGGQNGDMWFKYV